MISNIELDLFQLRTEFKRSVHPKQFLIKNNDFSYAGIFIKEFWLSDFYWETRSLLVLNINTEKEYKKYSLLSLYLFWMMIHRREYLLQSFSKKVAHYCFKYLSQAEAFDIALKKSALKSWGLDDDKMFDCLELDFKFFARDYWSFVWKIVIQKTDKIRAVISVHYFISHLNDTFSSDHFIYKKDLESKITFYLKEELKRQKAST